MEYPVCSTCDAQGYLYCEHVSRAAFDAASEDGRTGYRDGRAYMVRLGAWRPVEIVETPGHGLVRCSCGQYRHSGNMEIHRRLAHR